MDNNNKHNDKKDGKHGHMSRKHAGHLGGSAPHSCRGRECSEKGHKSSKE